MKYQQLSRFARKGYVVAVIQYRPSTVAPFPAQVKDTKTAIRFLIKNARTYSIDPERILLWDDSSGGHTAVMTGVTLDEPNLSNESPSDEPIRLKAIADFYGPIDVSKMNLEPSTQDHRDAGSPEGMFIGGVNVLENPAKVNRRFRLLIWTKRKRYLHSSSSTVKGSTRSLWPKCVVV